MLDMIVLPVIIAVIAGVLSWLAQERIEVYRNRLVWRADCRHFSGRWHSMHLTKRDQLLISRHRYDLRVSRRGHVTGTLVELTTTPEWQYKTQGMVGAGGWMLRSQSLTRPDEMAVEVYYNDVNENRMLGFLISYDLNRNPFCSFTLLSREELPEPEFLREYVRHVDQFYLPDEVLQCHMAKPPESH